MVGAGPAGLRWEMIAARGLEWKKNFGFGGGKPAEG